MMLRQPSQAAASQAIKQKLATNNFTVLVNNKSIMLTTGSKVQRVQCGKKYGVLPARALATIYVVLGEEIHNGKTWYRCNSLENLARVDGKTLDDWGKLCTEDTDSTIFLPIEVKEV
jgi:hypothetical protein